MKRHGQLLERVAEMENLRRAFHQACRGKRGKAEVQNYAAHLDERLAELRAQLLEGRVPVGRYHYFRIHDPKERLICAASFPERVLHHALMNVCDPVLERAAIGDSFACRTGKGRTAALARAQEFARRFPWFLKLDVRKYFDSVDHERLRAMLRRKFKDAAVLRLLDEIIASYQTTPGHGLPIGNLTSQHFANFYLAPLDRFAKETLGCVGYVRYMDDFVLWGSSGRELSKLRERVRKFLAETLGLELKGASAGSRRGQEAEPPSAPAIRLLTSAATAGIINRSAAGMEFLGARIFPHRLGLARRSKLRFRRKLAEYEAAFAAGEWTELELQQRVTALLAFVRVTRCEDFRRSLLGREGNPTDRLQPDDPWGQLGKHHGQPPLCQPQQQHPVESQQQQRLPVCPSPAAAPDGARLARSASRPRGGSASMANQPPPPGASRAAENSGRPAGSAMLAAGRNARTPRRKDAGRKVEATGARRSRRRNARRPTAARTHSPRHPDNGRRMGANESIPGSPFACRHSFAIRLPALLRRERRAPFPSACDMTASVCASAFTRRKLVHPLIR